MNVAVKFFMLFGRWRKPTTIKAHIYYQRRYIKGYAITYRNGERVHYSTQYMPFEEYEGAVRPCE